MKPRMVILSLLGLALIALTACDDDPTRPKVKPGWYSLGLEGERVRFLEFDYPYLYACVDVKGLYGARVTSANPKWEHLGMGNATFDNADVGALLGVIVMDDGALLTASNYSDFHGAHYPGVHRSEDRGLTWARADAGIRLEGDRPCGATCLSACEHYSYVGTVECGTYRSEDNGQHWDHIGVCRGCGYTPSWIVQSPADCSVIWEAGWTARESFAMVVSGDHGVTWNLVSPSHGFLDHYVIALDPLDADAAYVGIRGAVVKTVDLGSTFEPIMELLTGTGPAWPQAMAHGASAGHVFVAAPLYNEVTQKVETVIYETRDGGTTLDTLAVPCSGSVWDLLLDDKRQTLYMAGTQGVCKYVYKEP